MPTFQVDFQMFGTAYVEASDHATAVARLTEVLGQPVKRHAKPSRPLESVFLGVQDRDIATSVDGVTLSSVATSYGFIAAEVTETERA